MSNLLIVKAATTEFPRSQARGFQLIPGVVLFLANFAAVYVVFAPLDFRMPDYGLDPWMAVLGEASAHDWRLGRDIIFTSGPLSSLYTHWFQPDHLDRYLAANATLVVVFALLMTTVAWRNRRIASGFLVAAGIASCFFAGLDGILVAYPLLVCLIALSPNRGILEKASIALGVFCAALLTLAKFLIAPAAVIMFILCDIGSIVRRRWPFYTLAYVLLCFGLFAWVEGPRWFLEYVFSSISVASGYSEAMDLDGPTAELATFLAAAAVVLATLGLAEIRTLSKTGAMPTTALLRWLVLAAYVFVMFKEGFVRHDIHSLIGWSGLAVVALVYPLSLREVRVVPSVICWAVAGGAITAVTILFSGSLSMFQSMPGYFERQFVSALNLILDRERQIAQWRRAKEEAWARVRAAQEVPRVNGSVDVIPSIQSSLLAYGLDYRPRYSFQEYVTFTGRLIEANRRSLIERAPDFVLMQPGSIDNRYPALAEGPLWPDILASYAPISEDGKLLLLRRRTSPLGNLLGAEASQTVSFNRAVAVPDGPQFLRVKIGKTLLGKLIDVLFRPPIIQMRVGFADGTLRDFRIVPAIAEAGFLISPWVQTSRDFLLLAEGQTGLLFSIKGIAFETSKIGSLFYAEQIDVSFSPLSIESLQRAPENSTDIESGQPGR
jgi:hypothetical protein